jgi:hypothetical protein
MKGLLVALSSLFVSVPLGLLATEIAHWLHWVFCPQL